MAEQWKKIASGERLQDSLACQRLKYFCVCFQPGKAHVHAAFSL